jgi:hypothetical protein
LSSKLTGIQRYHRRRRNHQRVDLDHRAVEFGEDDTAPAEAAECGDLRPARPSAGNAARWKPRCRWPDRWHADDLLRAVRGNLLDLMPPSVEAITVTRPVVRSTSKKIVRGASHPASAQTRCTGRPAGPVWRVTSVWLSMPRPRRRPRRERAMRTPRTVRIVGEVPAPRTAWIRAFTT